MSSAAPIKPATVPDGSVWSDEQGIWVGQSEMEPNAPYADDCTDPDGGSFCTCWKSDPRGRAEVVPAQVQNGADR